MKNPSLFRLTRITLFAAAALAALARCGKDPRLTDIALHEEPPSRSASRETYTWLAANVFVPSCVKCHSDKFAAGKVNLSAHAKILDGKTVIPGNAAESPLHVQVAQGKMPKKADKLSAEKIQAISDWIRRGALND